MNNFKWLARPSVYYPMIAGALVLLLLLAPGRMYSQVSRWQIPNRPNIQGLDAFPENPNRNLYFTEYDQRKIGMINSIPNNLAILTEWPLVTAVPFHPFKITTGSWLWSTKLDPTVVTTSPFTEIATGLKPSIAATVIGIFPIIFPQAQVTFTMPDDNEIGVLMTFGLASSYWFWPTPSSGLIHPWDIQRRNKSYLEMSAWVSNREPQQAIYQFFPTAAPASIKKWDLKPANITLECFYVVPSPIAKGVTEIWIGGTHANATGVLANDCIVYMRVSANNIVASLRIWDLPPTPSGNLRTMNAIRFTHSTDPRSTFTQDQVWLSSSTWPEMTILEPNSLYKSTTAVMKDSICVVDTTTTGHNFYQKPNGLFWNDPVSLISLTAGDDNRRIWVTSIGDSNSANPGGTSSFISAVKGEVTQAIGYGVAEAIPTSTPVQRQVYPAYRYESYLTDSTTAQPVYDTIPCFTVRAIWNTSASFTPNFAGALLDINMVGKAAPCPTAAAFDYTIAWHEPLTGRIGMLWSTPCLTGSAPKAAHQSILDNRPAEFKLSQNYPNPFNPTTTIDFTLPQQARVTLKVYNTLGQEVATLINNEERPAGNQAIVFNSANYASGVYYYRIRAEAAAAKNGVTTSSVLMDVKKMIVVK
ncbi:MAG: T9SS type A sorting domain-containing protein [Bacteroidota bacterium]